ncbi:hypothetical protein KOSB73_290362 [Klebsiella grimontii]|uniref:Uncharacterized protein n=1 Tax=Klebsiella grimontii TaxID=2058152 RepID=A0A285B7K4_9ENTR|nr:hypothetical protein KOSB73_290362 [Klebsiella grimontii]
MYSFSWPITAHTPVDVCCFFIMASFATECPIMSKKYDCFLAVYSEEKQTIFTTYVMVKAR